MRAETPQPPPVQVNKDSRPFLIGAAFLLVLFVARFVIIAPVLKSAKRAAAHAQQEAYVRSADLALIRYMDEHGDRYPDLSKDMVSTLRPYINDPKVIEAMSRFVWNDKLTGKTPGKLYDPTGQWVVYSKTPGQNLCAVGYADGHVHYASPGSLQTIFENGEKNLNQK